MTAIQGDDIEITATRTHQQEPPAEGADEAQESNRDADLHKAATDPDQPVITTAFRVGATCSPQQDTCIPAPDDGLCDAHIADYEARRAADPTIPEETWQEGQFVTYEDGVMVSAEPRECRNTTPTPADPELDTPPQPTAAQVATAFQSIPLPKPDAAMDPSLPACIWTGWDNYAYVKDTDTAPITTTLLGTTVTIYPHVDSYTWDFGDGSEPLTTSDAGAPHPAGSITHAYSETGQYAVTVTINWSADWETAVTPRSAVPGTAHTTTAVGTAWVHQRKVVLVNDPGAPLPSTQHDPNDPCYA